MKNLFLTLYYRRFVFWAVVLTVSSALLFACWCIPLFSQFQSITSKRMLRRPACYFSDIKTIQTGSLMSAGDMTGFLKERGYVEKSGLLSGSKSYRKVDPESLEAFLPEFDFPEHDRESGGLFRFVFKGGSLVTIRKEPEGYSAESVSLEPEVLGDFSKGGVENRPWITVERVPEMLTRSILVAEDRRFLQHSGVDPKSVLRAIWINLNTGGVKQGGSTITQQLVKNAFLSEERTFSRKAAEALLSFGMEIAYDKKTILEMYLNQIYLGHRGAHAIYGVEDAALSYFGKHVWQLSTGECALIAGSIPAPNKYSVIASMEKALERREYILNLLLKNGEITSWDYKAAREEPVIIARDADRDSGNYYSDLARFQLEKDFGINELDSSGYKVYLSVDMDMQRNAERILSGQPMEGAIVAVDPLNGEVKALAGGRDFKETPFNRAVLSWRQAGSSFKPIVYAAALDAGAVTLATKLSNEPLKISQPTGVWEPQNYDKKVSSQVSVRDALVFSLNIPSVRVFELTGADKVIDLARSLGIKSKLETVPSLALGTCDVTPLELTMSYCAFANGGFSIKPVYIKYVTDSRGEIIKKYNTDKVRVISAPAASIMNNVLEDAVNRGTGQNVRKMGFQGYCAGKTGTSDNYNDAWFIGYTPELVCGVWLGYDKPASLEKAAAQLAVPVWVNFMNSVTGRMVDQDFKQDPELLSMTIDPETGLLARSGCPTRQKELFIKGTQPEYCNLHKGGIPGFLKRLFSTLGL